MALVPQVVDAVKQPVVAAGSIADGRSLAAALALGASGVLIGTRFVATKESGAADLCYDAFALAWPTRAIGDRWDRRVGS